MRSLLLADQSYVGQVGDVEAENQLVFTFSDKTVDKTKVWLKSELELPELFVLGLSLFRSQPLMIRDDSYKTHKGFYEVNSGFDRWVDLSGDEISNVIEWMKSPIIQRKTTNPMSNTRS